MLTVSYRPRAETASRMSADICRLGLCLWEYRLSVGKPFPLRQQNVVYWKLEHLEYVSYSIPAPRISVFLNKIGSLTISILVNDR